MSIAVRIRTLRELSRREYVHLVSGYVSHARYDVRWSDARGRVTFALRRRKLRSPVRRRFPHPAEELRRYRRIARLGWSLGAFDGRRLVGLVLAEPRAWNRSVWVWEVGVEPGHRRQGIGRALFEALVDRAREEGLRVLVCETQTTNAPAVDFYRALGFRVEGVDVSFYSNEDLERGEVAIFMKKRLETGRPSGRPRRRPFHTSK